MDHLFDWYNMFEARRVRFIKFKLQGLAKMYWMSVETRLEREGQEPIMTRVEMKAELKKKYLPLTFRDRLLDKLSNLKQGKMSVKEYMNKFDELVVRCDIHDRFCTGLRPTLQREMLPYTVKSVDETFQLALDIESYL